MKDKFNVSVLDPIDEISIALTLHLSMKHLQKRIRSVLMNTFYVGRWLTALNSNASMGSVSVLKRYFFNKAKLCSAGIVSLQALHLSRWDLIAGLDEL